MPKYCLFSLFLHETRCLYEKCRFPTNVLPTTKGDKFISKSLLYLISYFLYLIDYLLYLIDYISLLLSLLLSLLPIAFGGLDAFGLGAGRRPPGGWAVGPGGWGSAEGPGAVHSEAHGNVRPSTLYTKRIKCTYVCSK